MKLKNLRRGQDVLMRAIRHLANRAGVIRGGQIHWHMSPEAEADGIMTDRWNQLEAAAQRAGNPRRSKATPRRKKTSEDQ
jgi:hypothetical protein